MAEFHDYSPDEVDVLFAGIPITGWADGEFLTIEWTTDRFTSTAGTDGEVTRNRSGDFRATATVRLMQTSDSNDLLSALANIDRRARNGAGVGAFLVRDNQGRSLYTAANAWIRRPPNVSFDREATVREWVIEIANLEDFTGGN